MVGENFDRMSCTTCGGCYQNNGTKDPQVGNTLPIYWTDAITAVTWDITTKKTDKGSQIEKELDFKHTLTHLFSKVNHQKSELKSEKLSRR